MGASHSVVGDQSVPVELVIKILSYLAVADLTSCRCINHTLRDIIDASPDLQHQIDTALARVVDNYRITLSLPERRRALRLEQEAWDSCKPRFTKFCFPDLIQDSIYFKLHHLTPRIALAIVVPHCPSRALTSRGPILVICPSGLTARLSRLLCAWKRTILWLWEFGESFSATAEIMGLHASN